MYTDSTETSVTYIPSSEAPMFYIDTCDHVCTAVMETSEAVGNKGDQWDWGVGK